MAELKSERHLLEEISVKLDRLIGVTALVGKKPDEHAEVLIGLGLDAQLISDLTGLTKNAVNVRKTRMKKSSTSKSA
jgi:hypothetical protein